MTPYVLADSSVWIDKFRQGGDGRHLDDLLEENLVVMHLWVLGELALGNLDPNRETALVNLGTLNRIHIVAEGEVLKMIEARELWASGIGWVDAQLVAAALASEVRLWTLDRPLREVAESLGIAYGRGGGALQ